MFFLLKGHDEPWLKAGAWWTVFGSVADIGCIVLMFYFLRKERLSLRDLFKPFRGWKDVGWGFLYYLLIFPIHFGAFFASSYLVYGGLNPEIPEGVLHMRALPLWAIIYSVTIWWFIWSPTEEATYQAYALPRLISLFRKDWMAIAMVWFFWTLQHCALPLIPDLKYVLWRFLCFAPGMIPTILIYYRRRKLWPMVFAHWPMDIVVSFTTLIR